MIIMAVVYKDIDMYSPDSVCPYYIVLHLLSPESNMQKLYMLGHVLNYILRHLLG